MTSSTRLSVLAALLAAFALPIGAMAEPFNDDPEIEVGDEAHGRDDITMNGNNLTINDDIVFELEAGAQCDDFIRTAVFSDADNFNITIGNNGSLTIDDSACLGTGPDLVGIEIRNTDTPDVTSTGSITINGALTMPDTSTDHSAISIFSTVGATDITIGSNGSVFGNIDMFNSAAHTFENNGTFEGRVYIRSAGFDPANAPRASQTITNNGTMMAGEASNFVIETGNIAYTETEIIEGEGDAEDVEQLVREHNVTVVNNELMMGDIYFGPSGDHVFQNFGTDDDLDDDAEILGFYGTVLFGGGAGTPPESLGGTYQNFGTHVAGDDGNAVLVEAGRDPLEVLGGYDEDLDRHTIAGVNITNSFGGSIFGNIMVMGADSHGFTNQGTLVGRALFSGLGDNLITLSGGTIYRDDEDVTTTALVSAGDGRDRVVLSGTFLSPNEIVEPAEGEEAEDVETVDMTLIDLGDGDDFATLSSGGLIGATTAIDGGAGNDHITITPSGTSPLLIEGEISGGESEGDSDTLEINGGTTGLVTEVTNGQKYTDFENFAVTAGEVHLNLTEAVPAMDATDDMDAVAAVDATVFEVSGGDLFIGEGALLRMGLMGSLPTEGETDFIRHFRATSGTNEGTLVFDTMTNILESEGAASFTNAATGTLGFVVATETDEETGIASVTSLGSFYDSSTDDSMERLVLEAGSSIGLVLDNLTLATDLDGDSEFFRDELAMGEERDIFSELKFDVVYTPAGIVRTITPGAEEEDPDTIEDEDIIDNFDLEGAGINLVRDNPFYAFAFDVNQEMDGPTIISIIASRKPAFAFSLKQMGQDAGAGGVLDQIFEDTLNYNCDTTEDASEIASCAIDADIRELAKLGFGAYGVGVRGFEPNRHSGLWEGMLNNHKMTLGVVSLRSATYRADAGGMSATTQYAALPSYSTASDVLSVAEQQQGITGVNAGSIWESNRFWIQTFGGLSDRENSSSDAGYQAANGGVVLGYDRRVGRTQMFGIFASYGIADVDSSNIDQEELTINSYSGGVYYSFFSRTSSAEVSFSGGGSTIEGNRMPFLGGGTANYDTGGMHLALRGAADTNMKAGRFLITPNFAFQYTFMRQSDYDEKGTSPSLLSVDSINMHSIETTLGANVGLPLRMGRLAALPKIKLAWTHELLDETGDVDARLINIPSAGSFSAAAIEVPADRVTTGFGFDLASRGGTTFTLGYDFTLGSDFQAHGGAATFRFPF